MEGAVVLGEDYLLTSGRGGSLIALQSSIHWLSLHTLSISYQLFIPHILKQQVCRRSFQLTMTLVPCGYVPALPSRFQA